MKGAKGAKGGQTGGGILRRSSPPGGAASEGATKGTCCTPLPAIGEEGGKKWPTVPCTSSPTQGGANCNGTHTGVLCTSSPTIGETGCTGTDTGAGALPGTDAADSNDAIDHTDDVRVGGTDRQHTGGVAVRVIGDPPHPCIPTKPGGGSLLRPEPPGAAETRGAGPNPTTTGEAEDHGTTGA